MGAVLCFVADIHCILLVICQYIIKFILCRRMYGRNPWEP